METGDELSQKAQLELFNGWLSAESNQSRTVELFDAIPKYIFDKKAKTTTVIEAIEREFRFRDVMYSVRIAPANIDRKGKAIGVYPGEREEIVTRTLFYMSCQQLAKLKLGHDKDGTVQISASFTLSQLRKYLSSFGHNYSTPQIDEALRVCQNASISLSCEGGGKDAVLQSGIFMSYSGQNTKSDKTGESSLRYVVFNPLVTSSILETTSRAINFERVMKLKSPLSRWLYDRVSHVFRQAVKGGSVLDKGYRISLSTILRESGFTPDERVRHNVAVVKRALTELQENGVLERLKPYKEEITYGEVPKTGGRRPLEDVMWTLYPSTVVVEEIISDNKARKALGQ